jgi:hypothetical protein
MGMLRGLEQEEKFKRFPADVQSNSNEIFHLSLFFHESIHVRYIDSKKSFFPFAVFFFF